MAAGLRSNKESREFTGNYRGTTGNFSRNPLPTLVIPKAYDAARHWNREIIYRE
jgi:hypothetical protein